MGFSRQEYWSGLPGASSRDLPDLVIEPMSLTSSALAGRFFTTSATWEAQPPIENYIYQILSGDSPLQVSPQPVSEHLNSECGLRKCQADVPNSKESVNQIGLSLAPEISVVCRCPRPRCTDGDLPTSRERLVYLLGRSLFYQGPSSFMSCLV